MDTATANRVTRRLTKLSLALCLMLAFPAWASQSFIFIDRDQFLKQANATLATEPYLPINDAPKSFTSGSVTFTAKGSSSFLNKEWTDKLPGIDIALNDKEDLDMVLDAPVHAMGFGFEDRDGGAGLSTFTVTARLGTLFVDQFIFEASGSDVPNETFVGFWSPQLFDRLEIREVTSVNQNEFFGSVYTGVTPPGFISKLKVTEGRAGDSFGQTLGIAGDYAAIAAPGADEAGLDSGAVYLYQRGPLASWRRIARLLPQVSEAFDGFGSALALGDTVLAAGTPFDDDLGTNSGSVTLWERQFNGQWIRQPALLASDGQAGQLFGNSVAVDGQRILVGAPRNDDLTNGVVNNAGAAYLYEKQPSGSWLEVHKFVLDEPVANAQLGWSVAISGDLVAIAAGGIVHLDDGVSLPSAGSVYLFERQSNSEWSQVEELTSEVFREGIRYGQQVVMHESRLAVSEVQLFDPEIGAGKVTIYARNAQGQWLVESALRGEEFGSDRFFGSALALRDGQLLVGAPLTMGPTAGVGPVFLYKLTARNGWQLTRELPGLDSVAEDEYGLSVALDGASILIGATGDDDLNSNSGSAYLLEADRLFDIYDLLLKDGFETIPQQ